MSYRTLAIILLALSPFTLVLAAPATQPGVQPVGEALALNMKNWRLAHRWQNTVENALYSTAPFTEALGRNDDEFVVQTSDQVVDVRAKNLVVNPFRENKINVVKQVVFKTVPSKNSAQQSLVLLVAADFSPLRLEVVRAEPAGNSFKQFINQNGRLDWHQFSCMPDEGHKSGSVLSPKALVFENALPLMLRAYPFEGDHRPMEITLLPDQTSAAFTAVEPVTATIAYEGLADIDVADGIPNWHVPARTDHLTVTPAGGKADQVLHFWFATNPNFDHVLVQSDCHGRRLYLRRLEYVKQ